MSHAALNNRRPLLGEERSGCVRRLLLDLAGCQKKLQPVGVGELLLQRLNVFFANVLQQVVSETKESKDERDVDDELANLRQALHALLVFHFLHCRLTVALHHGSGALVCR